MDIRIFLVGVGVALPLILAIVVWRQHRENRRRQKRIRERLDYLNRVFGPERDINLIGRP